MSLTTGQQVALEPKERQKHEELALAVNQIDAVVERLNRLAQRISGDGKEENIPPDVELGSLFDVLNNSPKQILNKCDQMHGELNNIETMLF